MCQISLLACCSDVCVRYHCWHAVMSDITADESASASSVVLLFSATARWWLDPLGGHLIFIWPLGNFLAMAPAQNCLMLHDFSACVCVLGAKELDSKYPDDLFSSQAAFISLAKTSLFLRFQPSKWGFLL